MSHFNQVNEQRKPRCFVLSSKNVKTEYVFNQDVPHVLKAEQTNVQHTVAEGGVWNQTVPPVLETKRINVQHTVAEGDVWKQTVPPVLQAKRINV